MNEIDKKIREHEEAIKKLKEQKRVNNEALILKKLEHAYEYAKVNNLQIKGFWVGFKVFQSLERFYDKFCPTIIPLPYQVRKYKGIDVCLGSQLEDFQVLIGIDIEELPINLESEEL